MRVLDGNRQAEELRDADAFCLEVMDMTRKFGSTHANDEIIAMIARESK